MNKFDLTKNQNRSLRKHWKTISNYILPEMGTQSKFSKVKSISKDFMINFSKSTTISNLFLNILTNINLYLGYMNHNNDILNFYVDQEMEANGSEILKMISKTNQIEINKLFSEWDNKLEEELKDEQQINKIQITSLVKIIKKGIKRKNFKFPWTFKEVQTSFIETLLSYLEVYNIHKLKQSNKGWFIINEVISRLLL